MSQPGRARQRFPEPLRRQLRLADSLQLGLLVGLIVALYLVAQLAPSPERYMCHQWFRTLGPLLAIPAIAYSFFEGVRSFAGRRAGGAGFAPPFLRVTLSAAILVLL